MNNNKKVFAFLAAFLASTSVHADTSFNSPAFVQQAGGSSFSSMQTAQIMKPMFDIISALPRNDTPGLANNLALIHQTGAFNSADVQQTGSRNTGLIQQIGYSNAASIVQSGVGQSAFIFQQGRNNTAVIHQR